MDFWEECVRESFEDAKLVATDKQIDTVVCWVEGAHDNYGTATGLDVVSANYQGEKDREIENLKKQLEAELRKSVCVECKGAGSITDYGPVHSYTSQCHKCHGQGRV